MLDSELGNQGIIQDLTTQGHGCGAKNLHPAMQCFMDFLLQLQLQLSTATMLSYTVLSEACSLTGGQLTIENAANQV